jgi:hypothetical protein
MAKESVKARQRKREKMVAQYAEKREALKLPETGPGWMPYPVTLPRYA